jgi:hypothetical protein
MSYDNLSSVSENVLKFYQQLTGEEMRIPFIFDDFHFCRSRVIVPTKNERDPPLFTGKLLIKFQNILRNTTQVIIRHRVNISAQNAAILTNYGKQSILNKYKSGALFSIKLLLYIEKYVYYHKNDGFASIFRFALLTFIIPPIIGGQDSNLNFKLLSSY